MVFPDSFKISTPSDLEIQVTRNFGAPRGLVFDAFTKPELVRRWLLGPPGWTMPLCEIDLRVGGSYRYVWRSEKDGAQMAMGGVFREIVPLERLVATERFDLHVVLKQFGADALRLGIRRVDCVDRNGHRPPRRIGVIDRLECLRRHAVVGRHH